MRTLQEKYNATLEENFSKAQFVRDARLELPNMITQFNGFEDSVSILKNRGMIFEDKKAKVPEYDNISFSHSLESIERAIDYELEGMGLMSNETVSEEDYGKAKKKAEKNLKKDPNHYLHLLSGDSKKVDKHDKMVPVKKGNHVDTFNGLKKAQLREEVDARLDPYEDRGEILKQVMALLVREKGASREELKGFISTHMEDILNAPDDAAIVDEFEQYISVNNDYVDEKKGKDHDGDGDIDGDDYMMAKDKAIKGAMSEGRRRKMKGGKVVTENDYETGGYVESMGPMLDKILKQLISVWDEWKDGPATEPAMVPFAKKDLVSYIDSKIVEGEDIVEDSIEEHQELKEAFKAIISKVLQEEVITEAATGNLAKIASQYSDFEGMQAAVNDLENVVTDIESYYAKTKEKIQKVYDSFRDIKNAEGLAVGAMLGPAIEAAFKKDLIPVKGFTSGLEMPKVKMLETDEIAEEDLDEKETVFTPINEALNKELKTFGPDLKKKLDSMDFQSALFNNQSAVPMEAVQKIAKNSKLAGISYFKTPDGYERIEVAVNRERIKDLEKLKSYFSTPEGQYGPDKDTGWVIKNMRNVNPGDIYVSKVGGTSNIAKITYNRAEKTGSGKFGTDQVKSTDKIAAEGKKYKYSKKK